MSLAPAERKRAAGEHAVALVESGMVVGLGTGSTAAFATRRLAALLSSGQLHDVVGVPTSAATDRLARELGVPLLGTDVPREIDLTIDGADEVDPALDLIKGAGGALLREKIVAEASRRVVIVTDDSKLSPRLGSRSVVPVEVVRFAWSWQQRFLESLGARVTLRCGGQGDALTTDEGHHILDCDFGPIGDASALGAHLAGRAGVVGHGLFLGLATDVIVGGDNGVVHRRRAA
ncbi:MAG: ribose-5-phosphate isomerase RpiA [Gemmatimonadaceae bacterium]